MALDASDDLHRLRLLLDDDTLAGLARVQGDITDLAALERTIDEHAITHVIHLAALQVPFCRADPPLGARVNVVGTVNVFEAVARRQDRMGPIVYASSVAAYDALDDTTTGAAMEGVPSTLYGVFKRANEGTASVYAAEQGIASVGLRPHTVYGPGRDQGVTSAPTTAMLARRRGPAVRAAVRRRLPAPVRARRGRRVRRRRARAGRGRAGARRRRARRCTPTR